MVSSAGTVFTLRDAAVCWPIHVGHEAPQLKHLTESMIMAREQSP
jgi:hypothetical protein